MKNINKYAFVMMIFLFAGFSSFSFPLLKCIPAIPDSVPKSKSAQVKIDMSDFDRSMQEIDKAVNQLNKKVQDIDWNKISNDVNNSLSKIDINKIKEDIRASMKKIEWEKINGDVKKSLNDTNDQIQKAIKEIDIQLNSVKSKASRDELKKDMEELKKDLQKNKDQLQKEVKKSKSATSDY